MNYFYIKRQIAFAIIYVACFSHWNPINMSYDIPNFQAASKNLVILDDYNITYIYLNRMLHLTLKDIRNVHEKKMCREEGLTFATCARQAGVM